MTRKIILLSALLSLIFTDILAQHPHEKEKYTSRSFPGQFDALSISGTGTIYIQQGQSNIISFPRQSNVKYNMDDIAGHLYITNNSDSTLLISPHISKLSVIETKGNVKVVFLSPITLRNPLLEASDNTEIHMQFSNTILITLRGHDHSKIYLTGNDNIGLDMTLDGSASVNAMALGLQNLTQINQ